jgi:hypothetical protein
VPKLVVKIAIVAAIAAVACGFSGAGFESGVPVPVVLARLGPPIQIAYAEGQRIYYWRTIYPGGRICKIWGAARHHIIENWGYQDCT